MAYLRNKLILFTSLCEDIKTNIIKQKLIALIY